MLPFFSQVICDHLAVVLLILLVASSPGEAACPASDSGSLLNAMRESYAQVENYRTTVEVEESRKGHLYETKRFLYTFKKPDHIRIELMSPHKGTVLIYPDEHREVLVSMPGLLGFLKFHLSPDNSLLKVSAGQRIDQTDMGVLIRNISHTFTDQLKGEEQITEENDYILLSAVAENHFIKGMITRYRFFIDKSMFLPVRIEESTPNGTPERTIIFHHLTVNTNVRGAFMQ